MTLNEWVLPVSAAVNVLTAGVVLLHGGLAVWALARSGVDEARMVLAEGVLAALGFSLAASLLKVIGLQQWAEIRAFATIFVLRTLLKQVFVSERGSIGRRSGS